MIWTTGYGVMAKTRFLFFSYVIPYVKSHIFATEDFEVIEDFQWWIPYQEGIRNKLFYCFDHYFVVR